MELAEFSANLMCSRCPAHRLTNVGNLPTSFGSRPVADCGLLRPAGKQQPRLLLLRHSARLAVCRFLPPSFCSPPLSLPSAPLKRQNRQKNRRLRCSTFGRRFCKFATSNEKGRRAAAVSPGLVSLRSTALRATLPPKLLRPAPAPHCRFVASNVVRRLLPTPPLHSQYPRTPLTKFQALRSLVCRRPPRRRGRLPRRRKRKSTSL